MYLENLGYTYNDWEEVYCKEMSSGLSTGYISDWGGWHYYLNLEINGTFIGEEAMAKLNADFQELKDDFDNFMKWWRKNNNKTGEVKKSISASRVMSAGSYYLLSIINNRPTKFIEVEEND